eukprot:2350664-Prorocentrum_lima.AAC.1
MVSPCTPVPCGTPYNFITEVLAMIMRYGYPPVYVPRCPSMMSVIAGGSFLNAASTALGAL